MEKLIINKRHEMPLRKRLWWDGITIVLWIGWIYLWKPLLIVFYDIIMLKVGPDEIADVIFNDIAAIPFEQAIFMLIATPVVLFVLSRLNRHKAPSAHLVYENDDYAAYFDLKGEQLRQCSESRFVTVYHDEHGRVVALEDHILQKGEK